MAQLNEILVGRVSRGLQKLFGIKGSSPVSTLAPEVMPIHPLFNGVENRYLDGWNRFGADFNQPAVAASQGGIRLRNPATSNVIAIFEKIAMANAVAGVLQAPFINIGAMNADLLTVVTMAANRIDARSNQAPSLIGSRTSPAAIIGAQFWRGLIGTTNGVVDVISFEDQEITLLPGDGLTVYESQVNVALDAAFIWRERFLEEAERT